MQQQPNQANQANAPQFEIQRIFVKDISFEAPNTPHTFVEEWKPEVALNLETKSNRLQDNLHEVVLSITATVTTSKKTAFLVEVHQAGVFMINGFPSEQLHQMLGSFCPNILFPYAREVISDVVVRGGFPQLILAPVNFDALYAQHMEKQGQEGNGGGAQKAN
ncbi:protein-export chaperone SecB [Aquicella lusitana]|uniref:Protein-export protein SecB n=1 Tax=Aquicella lusitana TaxID=254246 RepID=A0A370GH32_9COXI|nr:protein-export chaperone SecB [Aquicella lusitana]RDI41694.1 protein translocase subunit secB [Aquicella lusitana]VVC72670.1 Protein-export protein SecB [Aquicella lusitana]